MSILCQKRWIFIPKILFTYFFICICFIISNFIRKLFYIFNRDILCLDFLVRAFVGLGDSNTVGSDVLSSVASGVGSGVGIWFKFSTGNILFFKLIRTFALTLNRNPVFFRKNLFSIGFSLYLHQLFLWISYFALYQHLWSIKLLRVYLLKI